VIGFHDPYPGFEDVEPEPPLSNGHHPAPQAPTFDLEQFNARLLVGTTPPIAWLIDGTLRLGELAMLAAMGAVGKSMLLLALALQLIQPKTGMLFQTPTLGGEVVATGSVVLFCAEDSRNEVWRRMEQLDPGGHIRNSAPHSIYIITIPDLAEPVYIVRTRGREIVLDRGLDFIQSVIDQVPNLVLVAIDPIQPFVLADLNQSAEAVQVAFNALSVLAVRTGAAFILAHHMRKNGAKDITSPEEAREAIRGSGDIVNRPRLSYALWPASKDDTTKVSRTLGIPSSRGSVFYGATVKANGVHNTEVQTYVRNDMGLLIDRTAAVRSARVPASEIIDEFIEGIVTACANGRPFARRGMAGLFERRSELPELFHATGRDRLEAIANDLLGNGRLVQAICGGTVPRWLDVPDGPFARGEGAFAEGAPTGKAGRKGLGK
jgi:hypothetical protein